MFLLAYILQKTVVKRPCIMLSYTMPITFGSPFCIRNSLVNVKSVSGVAVLSFFLFFLFVDTHTRVIHLKVTKKQSFQPYS